MSVGWLEGTKRTLRDVARDRRMALMLLLGFGAGLPILLVFATLSAWLRTAGIERSSIGLLSYVSLAYTLKFLWAPVIDRFDLPGLARLLGRRRAWMLAAQLGVAAGMIAMSFGDPSRSLGYMVVCALVIAFASATQDIVVDGWRIDSAPAERQGMMLAAYQLGYSLARICAGAGALYLADAFGWTPAYATMAALMLIAVAGCLAAPKAAAVDPPAGRGWRVAAREAVVDPFSDLMRRKGLGLVLILLLIMLYRLPDIVSGIMANPLYIDMKFTLSEIATVSKVYGVWIGIAGAFAGGIAVSRIGLTASLLVGGIAAAASNLMFAWLALAGHDLPLLVASISIDNFAGAFAGTALIAYMSSLTSPAFAATQYALLSSLYALPGKFVGGLSGFAVEAMGYPAFFVATAAVGLPVVGLCLALRLLPEERPAPDAAPAALHADGIAARA
ncbi:AmpG family muropeptide MFS transporter [Methylobacterium isbiliense]|jgi:PAT family beta-lactamase induction signal transducer AmpG|uniref:Anhydromuropeptide permease n=1 Tax=Methylobacterium isbiliense TaxID=315478 RepID=A0ABQ4S9S0_9HYPH|nr:MFS transporter [Methylobacterium isbiliense]MDN3626849.1 MFS transporter [Methylobacterium isbiliense]GJD98609.1 Anhydromuropeptide permease [Methylobacterium isbiliense]